MSVDRFSNNAVTLHVWGPGAGIQEEQHDWWVHAHGLVTLMQIETDLFSGSMIGFLGILPNVWGEFCSPLLVMNFQIDFPSFLFLGMSFVILVKWGAFFPEENFSSPCILWSLLRSRCLQIFGPTPNKIPHKLLIWMNLGCFESWSLIRPIFESCNFSFFLFHQRKCPSIFN